MQRAILLTQQRILLIQQRIFSKEQNEAERLMTAAENFYQRHKSEFFATIMENGDRKLVSLQDDRLQDKDDVIVAERIKKASDKLKLKIKERNILKESKDEVKEAQIIKQENKISVDNGRRLLCKMLFEADSSLQLEKIRNFHNVIMANIQYALRIPLINAMNEIEIDFAAAAANEADIPEKQHEDVARSIAGYKKIIEDISETADSFDIYLRLSDTACQHFLDYFKKRAIEDWLGKNPSIFIHPDTHYFSCLKNSSILNSLFTCLIDEKDEETLEKLNFTDDIEDTADRAAAIYNAMPVLRVYTNDENSEEVKKCKDVIIFNISSYLDKNYLNNPSDMMRDTNTNARFIHPYPEGIDYRRVANLIPMPKKNMKVGRKVEQELKNEALHEKIPDCEKWEDAYELGFNVGWHKRPDCSAAANSFYKEYDDGKKDGERLAGNKELVLQEAIKAYAAKKIEELAKKTKEARELAHKNKYQVADDKEAGEDDLGDSKPEPSEAAPRTDVSSGLTAFGLLPGQMQSREALQENTAGNALRRGSSTR